MATLFSDDFNVGVLGPNWDANTAVSKSAGVLQFSTTAALTTTTSAHADTADLRVTVTIPTVIASFDGGVGVRSTFSDDGASGSGYIIDAFTDTIELYRRIGGANTTLLTEAATFVSGDTIGLEVSGSNPVVLKVFHNGVQVGSNVSDSSGSRITAAGRTCIFNWLGGSQYDNFLVEDLSAPVSFELDVDFASAVTAGQDIGTVVSGVGVDSAQLAFEPSNITLPFDEAYVLSLEHSSFTIEGQEIPFILTQTGLDTAVAYQPQDLSLLLLEAVEIEHGQAVTEGTDITLTLESDTAVIVDSASLAVQGGNIVPVATGLTGAIENILQSPTTTMLRKMHYTPTDITSEI